MSIICPVCLKKMFENKLILSDKSYKCSYNHSFDISKDNYLNLLISKSNSGDNKELVLNRLKFLESGYYENLVTYLNEVIDKYKISSLLDCGCGVGYYKKRLKTNTFGIDISKDSIKIASKNDTNLIVASSKMIPFSKESLSSLLYIFSPIFFEEAIRVLKVNGYLIIVRPNPLHLVELKKLIYPNIYLKNKQLIIPNNFILKEEKNLTYFMDILGSDLESLLLMTPYAYKTSKNNLKNVKNVDILKTTASFSISIYQKIK